MVHSVHTFHNFLQRIESLLDVVPSRNTEEAVRVDILLCQLMNKLHPGMIQYIHVEVYMQTVFLPEELCLQEQHNEKLKLN